MRIVGFAQLNNELEKGNLENWMNCMQAFCDKIYIYDQASDDGSIEYYQQFSNIHAILSETNRFEEEQRCKQNLLNVIRREEEDGTWIFWMDGDTFLEKKFFDKNYVESFLENYKNFDGISLRHYNLWRSDLYYRVDNLYHGLYKHGVVCFWKLSPNLMFENSDGLHKSNCPLGMQNIAQSEDSLIHRGFATDKQIVERYKRYWAFGQRGPLQDRLIDERTLSVKKLDKNLIPLGYPSTDVNPTKLKKLIELYDI